MVKISKPSNSAAKTKSKYTTLIYISFAVIAILNGIFFYYLKQSSCPEGYIKIPIAENVLNMCVAKYEMKKDNSGNAVSRPEGLPWVKITLNEAIQACRANGKRYDLITNQAWNYIGITLSEVGDNWNTGIDMYGALNTGFVSKDMASPLEASADDINDNCYKTDEDCNFNTWAPSRRTHVFQNKEVIWDLSGNVAEFVSGEIDANVNLEFNYIKFLQKRKYQFKNFGPENICTPETGTEMLNYYCGFGFFNTGMDVGTTNIVKIQNPEIIRGGNWKAPKRNLIGMFATTLIKPGTRAQVIGFRCTYSPMPQIRSFGDLSNLLQ